MNIVDCQVRGDALVVFPRVRRIDAKVGPAFRGAIVRAAGTAMSVVIDMSMVEAIDSTGLGCLIAILKTLPSTAQVRLVGVQPTVHTLLELTRLVRIFVEYPSIEAAISA